MNSSQSSISAQDVALVTFDPENPGRFLGSTIRNLEPARSSSITRSSPCSSVGRLDRLPTEVLIIALSLLDFKSLSSMSQTSIRVKELVESLPAYRDMMQYAPVTLTALGRTGLLKYHSAMLLSQTLRSKECVSCGDFGAFLLLSRCERACFECLDRNIALHAMLLTEAKTIFGLTDAHLQSIPIMKTIPGQYRIRGLGKNKKATHLVNIKEAKELAIKVHGSIEALEQFKPVVPREATTRHYRLLSFHQATLDMPGRDMSTIAWPRDQTHDRFGGATVIRFPYVSLTGPDNGRLCRGCGVNSEYFRRGMMPDRLVGVPKVRWSYARELLRARVSQLRTEPDFLEHIKHCYGAGQILAKLDD